MSGSKRLIKNKFNSQSGKSLIEIVLVLLLIGIVSTFAIIQYRSAKTQYERQNVARLLKIGMERARFDSVKRRTLDPAQQAKVIINQSWFSITTDANADGIINAGDTEVMNLANLNIGITGQEMVFPVSLTFDNRGNVASAIGGDGANINPIFYVCNGLCTPATLTAANSEIVLISPAGTVNLLSGNAALPTFSNPSVTNIAGETDVNCQVAVSLAGCGGGFITPAGTATPAASVSPTSTPTAIPSPTLTPTPSPNPVTQTPTPVACLSNEKPALAKCWCQPPMTVKKNGKCN